MDELLFMDELFRKLLGKGAMVYGRITASKESLFPFGMVLYRGDRDGVYIAVCRGIFFGHF